MPACLSGLRVRAGMSNWRMATSASAHAQRCVLPIAGGSGSWWKCRLGVLLLDRRLQAARQ
eukprot:3163496-Alexandrium_andersonii.AAC.1